VLQHPDFSLPFVLHCDASQVAIGAVLSQEVDGQLRPIEFASKAFSPTQSRYSNHQREACAIIWSINHFRSYLYGHKFEIHTDHAALKWLLIGNHKNTRLTQWYLQLAEYDFTISHVKGKANKVADALSRQEFCDLYKDEQLEDICVLAVMDKDQTKNTIPLHDTNPPLKIMYDDNVPMIDNLPIEQDKDPLICLIRSYLTNPKGSVLSDDKLTPVMKRTKNIADRCVVDQNNVVYHLPNATTNDLTKNAQIFVPFPLVKTILDAFHGAKTSGHFGKNKTFYTISRKYYWPNMFVDVSRHIKSCNSCQMFKVTPQAKVPLSTVPYPVAQPFEIVAVDFIGPFSPPTRQGNKFILTVVDYTTRWAEAYATPNNDAVSFVRVMIDFITRFGAMRQLLSDRAAPFLGEIAQGLMQAFQITKITTTAYHPQCNGLNEKFNGTLVKMLTHLVDHRGRQLWDTFLPYALMAYRSAVQDSLRDTPYHMLFGRDITIPLDIGLNVPANYYPDYINYKEEIRYALRDAWQVAKRNIDTAKTAQKRNYDRKAKPTKFHIGQLVMIFYRSDGKTHRNKKLTKRFYGPARITDMNDVDAIVQMVGHPRSLTQIHLNRLRPYTCSYLPQPSKERINAMKLFEIRTGAKDHLGDDYDDEEPALDLPSEDEIVDVENVDPVDDDDSL